MTLNLDFTIGHTFHEPPLPLDKPWPHDMRSGLANDQYGIEVWLDDEQLCGVVSVDPDTGYYLQYEKDPWLSTEKIVYQKTKQQPCDCLPGMHAFSPSDNYCIPMQLKHGNIKIKRATSA